MRHYRIVFHDGKIAYFQTIVESDIQAIVPLDVEEPQEIEEHDFNIVEACED